MKDEALSGVDINSSLASKMERPSSSRLTCRSAPKASAPPLVDDVAEPRSVGPCSLPHLVWLVASAAATAGRVMTGSPPGRHWFSLVR